MSFTACAAQQREEVTMFVWKDGIRLPQLNYVHCYIISVIEMWGKGFKTCADMFYFLYLKQVSSCGFWFSHFLFSCLMFWFISCSLLPVPLLIIRYGFTKPWLSWCVFFLPSSRLRLLPRLFPLPVFLSLLSFPNPRHFPVLRLSPLFVVRNPSL